jgi:hypothetical protein
VLQCFRCGGCDKALVGVPFGEKDGRTYCQACMVAKARSPGGVHTATHTPGFTVNPTTGDKEQRGAGGAMLGTRTPGLGTKDRCPKCEQPVYMGPDKVWAACPLPADTHTHTLIHTHTQHARTLFTS